MVIPENPNGVGQCGDKASVYLTESDFSIADRIFPLDAGCGRVFRSIRPFQRESWSFSDAIHFEVETMHFAVDFEFEVRGIGAVIARIN